MAKWNLDKLAEENSKKFGNNSIYDLSHHGDEVIVNAMENKIMVAIKIQTGIDEFRSTLMTFQSQSQMERLLPSLMKGLQSCNQ